jgi:hypothetical protein
MESWQTLYTLFQKEAQDTNTVVLTDGKADLNRAIRTLETECDLPPLERTRSITTTTAGTYALPQNFVRLKELYVTLSDVRYKAIKVYDEITWQMIKQNSISTTSNILTHVFVRPGSYEFEIYPTPSDAGNTMSLIYEALGHDLTADDYVTGGILTLANGGTAMVGTGTTWTAAMAGRWIKPATDYDWYLIDSFTSTTALTLKHAYQGSAISSSTGYTIGEMSRLPAGRLQRAPVSFALWRYFETKRRDKQMAAIHKNDWEEAVTMAKDYTRKHVSSIVPSVRRLRASFGARNPNAYPHDVS